MTPEDRAVWDEKSRVDKERYEAEMAAFKQHQKLHNTAPAKKVKKDPNAPKRPMSAFLAFSNQRRAALKRKNPDATNADLSKMLSVAWKEASPEFKAEYVEEEARLREQYKIDIVAWRKKKSEEIRSNMGKKGNANAVAQARVKKAITEIPVQPLIQQGMNGTGIPFGFGQQGMIGGIGGGNQFGGLLQQQQQQQVQQQQFYHPSFQSNTFQANSFQGGANPAMYQAFQMHPQFAAQTQQQSMMGGVQGNLYSQPNMQQVNYNAGNPYGMMGFSSNFDGYGGQDGSVMYLNQHHHDGN